jgi:hypothetical protein
MFADEPYKRRSDISERNRSIGTLFLPPISACKSHFTGSSIPSGNKRSNSARYLPWMAVS